MVFSRKTNQDFKSSFIAILITLTLVLILVASGAAGGLKLLFVLASIILFIIAAAISGNPRLLILWTLIFALPMALSKHFGEIVYKGGGEQSFRIELYDPLVWMLALLQFKDAIVGRTIGIRIPRLAWFWVAIMVMGVVDVIQGPWRTYGAQELVRMFKVLLLFIVLVNELKTPQRMLQCIPPLAMGVLLQSGIGIAQYLKGTLLGLEFLGETTASTITNLAMTSVQGSQVFRPSGLLLHANIFGIYLATALPLLIGTFLISRHFLSQLFLIFAILLGVVGLLLSQSRAAWVAFAIAFIIFIGLMMVHRRLAKKSVLALVGSSVGVISVLVVFSDRIIKRLFESKSDATVGRDIFLQDFYQLISDHWLFGVGINAYTRAVEAYLSFSIDVYDNWVPPVHNIYYLWWGEMGIFGLILYMALWLGLIWKAIQNLKITNDILYMLNAACLASMIGFLFDGLLGFALRVNQPQRMFFFFAAIIMAIHYWRQATPDSQS